MKQLLLIFLLSIGMAATASAQTKNNHSKKTTKKHTMAKRTTLTSSSNHAALNQRKMYHWQNGQAATPTGAQATGVNETQAVSKDSAKTRGGGNRGNHGQK